MLIYVLTEFYDETLLGFRLSKKKDILEKIKIQMIKENSRSNGHNPGHVVIIHSSSLEKDE